MFRMPHCAAAITLMLLASAPAAVASGPKPPLLKVTADGRVETTLDRLPADLTLPGPLRGGGATARAARAARPGSVLVERVIATMVRRKQLGAEAAAEALAAWRSAVAKRHRTGGTAGASFGSALEEIVDIAARGSLTASRVRLVTLTARRNSEFFGAGRTAAPNQRVVFAGSDLVWQNYPGKGLQLQVLASFGVANGLWRAGLEGHLRKLLDELAAVASKRAGGIAWEYGFGFNGGDPPWASGMAQATGIQAMSRGAKMLGDARYSRIARSALTVFDRPPPSGVRLDTALGPWYLMYSVGPRVRILNGFLQTLIGLDEMRDLTGDPAADRLFRSADPVARAAIPSFRTSGWSFYTPGSWDSVSYHSLTTGFLEELCRRTSASAYCSNGAAFRRFLNTAPSSRILTARLKAKARGRLRFWLSKPASIVLTVTRGVPPKAPPTKPTPPSGGANPAAARPLLKLVREVTPGEHWWSFAPPSTGTYTVTLSAKDAGGRARTVTSALSATRR